MLFAVMLADPTALGSSSKLLVGTATAAEETGSRAYRALQGGCGLSAAVVGVVHLRQAVFEEPLWSQRRAC